MPIHVHIQSHPEDDALKALHQALDNDIELSWGSNVPDLADYSVLVSGRPSRELMDASGSLNTLVIPWAGLPVQTSEMLKDYPDIVVHNLHHNATATAEIAVALMLSVAKSVVPIDRRFRGGDWSDRGQMQQSLQLEGRTALVLGYGAIGARIARVCRALNMDVHAVARNEHKDEHGIEVHLPDDADELFSRAQVVVVALPATSETEGFVSAARLAKLPQDAIFVNVARGGIVDEKTLYEALRQKRIFGAGLDVWWTYPDSKEKWTSTLPSVLPFHKLYNVVMSPHRGGHVAETEVLRMRALAEVLNAASRGQPIPNRVDLKAGY